MSTNVNDKFSQTVIDVVAKSRMTKAAKVWKAEGGKIVASVPAK